MIKNILSVLIFLFSLSFLFFLGYVYISDEHEKKIYKNRKKISQKIINNMDGIPFLPNDTNNVIEFNSGFDNKNIKIERNFWKLFKK